MFGVIMPLCNRMFCYIFVLYFYIEIRLRYEKNILLSTLTFSLSTPVEHSEATLQCCLSALELFHRLPPLFHCPPLWKTVKLQVKKLKNATNMYFSLIAHPEIQS